MKLLAAYIFILISCVSAGNIYGAGPEYQQAMKTSIAALDSVVVPQQYMQLANNFTRIANVESAEWLPDYYAAYCFAMSVFTSHDKKNIDTYLDQADLLIKKADSISPDNSEIITVKGLISSARIMADPMSRGKKYGTLANQQYKQAEKLDSLNPRPVLLEGQGLFYTPKMFGGGKDKAKPVIEKALVKYNLFKPANDIAPHWGRKMAEDMLKQCQ